MEQDASKVSSIKIIHDFARQNKIVAEYKLEKESGPAHAKSYTVRLNLGEKEYVGVDRSIKLAQRAAARHALDDNKDLLNNHSDKQTSVAQSPTVILNTLAARHRIPTRYVFLQEQYFPPLINTTWKHTHRIFHYRLHFGQDLYFDGHGSSHQQARVNCANHALNFIQQNENSTLLSCLSTSKQTQPKSQISLMYERAKQLGLSIHIEHNEPFTVTYHIGEQYSTTGTGHTKHEAKQIAAEKMLEILPSSCAKDKEKENARHNRKHTNQHKKFIEQKARARDVKIEFVELDYTPIEKLFHFHVKFDENNSADGYGRNKQAAKRSAAENLLSKLNPDVLESIGVSTSSLTPTPPIKSSLKHDETSNKQNEKKHVHFVEEEIIQHEINTLNHESSTTIKQQLINACQKLNIDIKYDDQTLTNNNNSDNTINKSQCESILTLSKDDRLLAKFRAYAPSLIRAQENVSLTAWRNLQQLFNGSVHIPKAQTKKRYRPLPTSVSVQQQQ